MIHIFNTTIAPTPGLTYRLRTITDRQARNILQRRGKERVQSAIGHEATAAIASEVLGEPVAVNRIEASVAAGDRIVAVKLRSRPPEGKVLSRAEMEAIGWDLVLMTVSAR